MKADTTIRRGELYSKAEACSRLAWGRASWRKALSDGLKVARRGRLVYVTGDAIIELIAGKPEKAD